MFETGGVMKELGENIWVHDDVMSLAGKLLELRMTIVKLSNGGLWVHSPTALSPELIEEIKTLGSVSFIVGASNGHNIWLREWQDAFPDAALYVSGGIPKKLKLTNYQVLSESHDSIWAEDLDREFMLGVPLFNESVFFHKSTKSLIVTDLIQNYPDERPPGFPGFVTKYLFEPIGFKGTCVAPPLKMGFMIKDKQNFALFIERVLDWDFERIIVTHGDIIETNAKQIFSNLCNRFLK